MSEVGWGNNSTRGGNEKRIWKFEGDYLADGVKVQRMLSQCPFTFLRGYCQYQTSAIPNLSKLKSFAKTTECLRRCYSMHKSVLLSGGLVFQQVLPVKADCQKQFIFSCN